MTDTTARPLSPTLAHALVDSAVANAPQAPRLVSLADRLMAGEVVEQGGFFNWFCPTCKTHVSLSSTYPENSVNVKSRCFCGRAVTHDDAPPAKIAIPQHRPARRVVAVVSHVRTGDPIADREARAKAERKARGRTEWSEIV